MKVSIRVERRARAGAVFTQKLPNLYRHSVRLPVNFARVCASLDAGVGIRGAAFADGGATFSASLSGTVTATLTVNPTGGSGSTAPLTPTASGRSGEWVNSSPAGLKVSVGTTGTACFPTGTLVTLSVSNGRDAIWSGGCSSGDQKTKSCSLTPNAATSVAADVQ